MDPWSHQTFAVEETLAAIARGERRICLTSPTGGGKTWVACELIRRWLDDGLKVALYTNRKLLVEQTSRVLTAEGVRHGVRANGYDDYRHRAVQVSSIQTEHARVLKGRQWELHEADRVLIDEAHLQKGNVAKTILDAHLAAGAAYVGLTATPLGIGDVYDHLIVAGTTSELRACGALVLCHHYGPDEPDLRHIGKVALGEDLTEKQNRKAIMTQGVFGRVITNLLRLNPELKPSILFAPGVPESLWFAERLHNPALRDTEEERALPAITAAHIDGETVWVNGKLYRSSKDARAEVMEMSKDGRVAVLCNRYVLREGIDAPWLAHGIFATVFGSLQSYLQSGGRLLRAHHSLSSVTLQDHGGCLDTETEILTARGWVRWDTIRDDDVVAALDRYNSHILWKPILHRHNRFLEVGEKMFSVNGRCINLRVTGNHRLLYNKRATVDGQKIWPDHFDLSRADDLADTNWRFQIPISGLQPAPGLSLTDDELRFIGWWLTDGTMAGKRKAVSISQADHQPQIHDLRACLIGCGFNFRETVIKPNGFPGAKPGTKFHIPKGTCKSRPRRGWKRLELYLDKNLSRNLELVDERQFAILLHAIHLGDGAKDRNEGSYQISTGNKAFADNLQSLAVRRGWKCNIHIDVTSLRLNPIYVLNLQHVATTTLHGSRAITSDNQVRIQESPSFPALTQVWCVANELETLVTRRNGMVAIIGNSWWRHGSLNADREWRLDYTAHIVAGLRDSSFRNPPPGEKSPPEPFPCPVCRRVLTFARCPCGWSASSHRKSRAVIQADGAMKEMTGSLFKPRRVTKRPDAAAIWERMYYRSLKADRTFAAAEALFACENNWGWPSRELPLMPTEPMDFFRRVADVPRERLRPKPKETI